MDKSVKNKTDIGLFDWYVFLLIEDKVVERKKESFWKTAVYGGLKIQLRPHIDRKYCW